MSYLIDKPTFTAQMYDSILANMPRSTRDDEGSIEAMRLLLILSGVLVETLLLFDDPDEGLDCTRVKLSMMLDCTPREGEIGKNALPQAYFIDNETEKGRTLARQFFEEWLNCAYEFHELILFLTQNVIVALEREGQPRSEIFRLFMECATRCLGYEIAAQELCDLVIDQKIGREDWSISDSVCGLSAVAGRRIALYHQELEGFDFPSLPEHLDKIAHVMTQESIRLGIPSATEWRFGLAANDYHINAPYDLIVSLEPEAWGLFSAMGIENPADQSVACAKAAGRMLAVAAGGEVPELEAVIAKPLAMAAMTATYRTVCQERVILSC